MRSHEGYDKNTGLPINKSYLESDLPDDLRCSIAKMERSWAIEDSGKRDMDWDIYWSELNADINYAEVNDLISPEQAWYLREKYLRMERSA